MEDLHMNNTSQKNSFNYSNNTSDCNESKVISEQDIYHNRTEYIIYVFTCTVTGIGLPLTLVAIYALYCQVRNGQVAPICVINLLITDFIQLCSMIIEVILPEDWKKVSQTEMFIHSFSVRASICFMVCVAMERYLIVAWPLWYRFRRTIKISVVVCVVVWVFSLVFHLIFHFLVDDVVYSTLSAIYYVLPFLLLTFFLGGTLKALSACTVPSDEKRRIVGVLVLVLLIYTLLFMPLIIVFLSKHEGHVMSCALDNVSRVFLRLSPLADLTLYVFMRKGIIDKLLASVCCCRMDSNDISRSSGNDDNIHTVSSV